MRMLTAASLILGLGICFTVPSLVEAAPPDDKKKATGPIVKKSPGPVVKKSPGPVYKKSPGPVYKKAPGPVVKKAPGPIVKVPGPIIKKGPGPTVKYVPVYKTYHKRRYYGRVFAGVVIGTIVAASAYYALSTPPDPDLCWYWANPYHTRGYWDFCDEPPPGWY